MAPREKKKEKAVAAAAPGEVSKDGQDNAKTTTKKTKSSTNGRVVKKSSKTSAIVDQAAEIDSNAGARLESEDSGSEAGSEADINFHDADGGADESEKDRSSSTETLTKAGANYGAAREIEEREATPENEALPERSERGAHTETTAHSQYELLAANASGTQSDQSAHPSPPRIEAPITELEPVAIEDRQADGDKATANTADGANTSDAPTSTQSVLGIDDSRLQQPLPQTPDIGTNSVSPSASSKRSLWGILSPNASQSTNGTSPARTPSTELGPKIAASLSNSFSSFAAGLSAVRRGGSEPSYAEKIRLPRREVDEGQLAEEVMRFADARHILRTSSDPATLKDLGTRLEEGWRSKVSLEKSWTCNSSSDMPFQCFVSCRRPSRFELGWKKHKTRSRTLKMKTSTYGPSLESSAS